MHVLLFYTLCTYRHTWRHSKSMLGRFSAMHEDIFCYNYDDISHTPFPMMDLVPYLSAQSVDHLNKFAIKRDFRILYICHWNDIFIRRQIVSAQSLSFQDDKALISILLKYPQLDILVNSHSIL